MVIPIPQKATRPFHPYNDLKEDCSDDDDGSLDESSGQSVRRTTTTRPTRAIPIPHRNPPTRTSNGPFGEDGEEEDPQSKRRCELATWRMYDLIVSYRQKTPFGQSYNPVHHIYPATARKELAVPRDKEQMPYNHGKKEPTADDEEPYEEIFDMDDL